MSTSYTHFTIKEREKLLILLDRGLGIRAIARELGRAASTVSRELKRNCSKDSFYSAIEAEEKYRQRRKHCVKKRKLDDTAFKEKMRKLLLECWSPEQIDGRLKLTADEFQASYTTIYRGIRTGNLQIPKKCLRRGGRKPSPHSEERRGRLHDHKTIHDRPASANDRSCFGHWEGDTVRGAQGKGVICTFVERKSGFLVAALMPDRKAKTLNNAMYEAFKDFPPSLLKSFTVDHGNEFFAYEEIEKLLNTQVYFADPYHPWQRGLNENTNGLLRQYFPKKCDFLKVTPEEFSAVVDAINSRPRKRLGFRSPKECFPFHHVLHLV